MAEFQAECLRILGEVAKGEKQVEVLDHGHVIAVVMPPSAGRASSGEFIGCLKGTVTYHPGWDAPLGPGEWETCR